MLTKIPSLWEYVGDSFGDGRYVKPENPRKCSPNCGCRAIDSEPEQNVFSFVVQKTPDTMMVTVHSALLWAELRSILQHSGYSVTGDSFDCFILLKHRKNLIARLRSKDKSSYLFSELEMLVKGVLSDYEIFQSYGFEDLCSWSNTTMEAWLDFQYQRFDQDLDALNDTFSLAAEVEEGDNREKDPTYSTGHMLESLKSSRFEAQKESVDGTTTSESCRISGRQLFMPDMDTNTCLLPLPQLQNLQRTIRAMDDPNTRQSPRKLGYLLVEAIKFHQQDIAEKLLNIGADINTVTPVGTALGVAAIIRSEVSIRFLLKRGADPELATLELMTRDLPAPNRANRQALDDAVTFLDCVLTQFRHDTILRLRREFIQQHKRAVEAYMTNLQAYSIDPRYRNAWSMGIKAMRNLSRGSPPSNLSDILSLLLVIGSMAVVMDEYNNNHDLQGQFQTDLSHWEAIVNDHSAQLIFRRAVWGIWRKRLESFTSTGPDADVLIELQYTALEFMFRSEGIFKLGPNRNRGLLYSQQIWRQKNSLGSSSPDGTIQEETLESNAGLVRDGSRMNIEHNDRPPERESVENNRSVVVAAFIMAGAIFGIMLAFLIGTPFL
jgi:hypothetical protein